MALVQCPECGKEISDQAISCPNCGYTMRKEVEFVVISVIVICATESRHEEKSASDDVLPKEKGDWYIHYLSQPQEEQDENDEGELHKEM